MKVLNFGSLNIDHSYKVDHIANPGETISAYDLEFFAGGKGLNQSVSLAKAGVDTYHAGAVGKDDDILVNFLERSNVNTDNVMVLENALTGHAIIQVDKNGQNSIFLFGGANTAITDEMADNVLKKFDKGDILLLQNEINNLAYIIKKAHENGMVIYFNPAPYDSSVQELPLEYIDCFIVNEIEAEGFVDHDEPDKMIIDFKNKYPKADILMTLGKSGSIFMDKDGIYRAEAFSVKAINTTGAGDTFIGYFIAGRLNKMNQEESLKMASAASAISVTRQGAAQAVPTIEEVKSFLTGK